MSYGQWTPNWPTWRNWETGNARNWQTEASSSTRNWQARMAPPPPPPVVRNWQTGMAPPPLPPPPPPVWNWQTGMAPPPPPPPGWYTGTAPYWNRPNAMATRDGWRIVDTDGIGNWQTELTPDRNRYTRPNYNTWSWQTSLNRRAWNWQTGSLLWTNWQTEQDYTVFFPIYLALPAASNAGAVQDPWRPAETRTSLLLTGNSQLPGIASSTSPKCSLQEIQEFPDQGQTQLPAQEEQPRLTRAERRAALRRLKKKTYSPLLKRDGGNVGEVDVHEKENKDQETEACAICLEDFRLEEEVMLTPCNHTFHENCIVPWVKSHAQCPICRLRFGRLPMNTNQP